MKGLKSRTMSPVVAFSAKTWYVFVTTQMSGSFQMSVVRKMAW